MRIVNDTLYSAITALFNGDPVIITNQFDSERYTLKAHHDGDKVKIEFCDKYGQSIEAELNFKD